MDQWSFDFLPSGMLRNIPNKVDQPLLKKIVDASSFGKYDFMYLRIDFANDCNVGYAFINFVKAEYIVDAMDISHRLEMCDTPTLAPEEVQAFMESLQRGGMTFFGARHVETDGSHVYVCFEVVGFGPGRGRATHRQSLRELQ
ncbi:hypothetical protein FCULG_00010880 [Fusarium culmorum]|uniref:Mei2-like C-terminal RNA recognition motif domain-containing protein n=1 Tax=Fusarium culmorum TaxID=5516 RepID=A0A2T4GYT8_FUSCU|nr:hypothetical protein FCULG_00010880 [Fusarium culmorum]